MPAPSGRDLIDRVDDHDQVIGSVAREDALASGAAFRTVHVLVVNRDGDVLLQRVGEAGTRSPGLWGSSAAGYLFAGEAPVDGARRRVAEEIGLAATAGAAGSQPAAGTINLSFVGRARMDDEGSVKFIHIYLARLREQASPARIVDDGHVAELRYWDVAEVANLLKNEPGVFTATFPHVFDVAEPALRGSAAGVAADDLD